jgi:glycolate oxidase iron-sulfur subunit
MQTTFAPEQLADPRTAEANAIIRKCVHCGFCTATCPTYVLLGNELDSPRGRIYLIKDMLEQGRAPTKEVVTHLDRCLSCLACKTTCPSGVDYAHLIDEARAHVEQHYTREPVDRFTRALLAAVLPWRSRFRASVALAKLGRPFAGLMEKVPALKPFAAMLALAPPSLPRPRERLFGVFPPTVPVTQRVILLAGCAQTVLAPQINLAAIRLLNRLGVEVIVPEAPDCCGALTLHIGKEKQGVASARANVEAWAAVERQHGPVDAVLITASGCGTTVKDYGHVLRFEADIAETARRFGAMARDVSQYLYARAPSGRAPAPLRVAYHAACSLQHGQKVTKEPSALLQGAGFTVLTPADAHLCCGSAGTYNLLQPEIAAELKARKLNTIAATKPDVIATGNIGCMTQLGGGAGVPIVHTVELLDWANGGPRPAGV